ncbi:hypothetical protein SLV14_004491 [Streptomyces sp. Je 1-4]|uniref:hypothetical protein n=1 Tax=Streptomyces TaxID=1883 RepID=UPI0021D92BA9|nr:MULTISPECIES: hypothetical protein [unclassified Streptomyces]UYB41702.1 hypothetical protein SLV14_004491 [Streptomyces sp. Je 1-4]UZQ37960.1 hypothetical protein SLV14N_004491 [Streptomyces sp. Je 1-4] [Streptomyces sp. Je 1-4 4N24]UZQ45377.1 hypothetical protein SLV14NA_004491 [Streptomyces sp. Je 1-4] [Streptomyces sp. Je 1-4 4N24_ara]
MRRTDAVRMHSEEAAAYSRAAETAVEPTRTWLLGTADDHQAMADAARLGDYHYTDLED